MFQLVLQRDAKISTSTASNEAFSALKVEYDATNANLKASEDLLQTLLTGISSSSDDTTSSGFMGQLAAAKALASNVGTEAERAKAKIEHLQKEVKEKEPKAKKAAAEGKGLIGELEKVRGEKVALEKALQKLDWDEEKEGSLRSKKDTESKAVRKLEEVSTTCTNSRQNQLTFLYSSQERDALRSSLASLDFAYKDPHRGFDRSTVKGLIANLVHIENKYLHVATALEVCAGGRLYNVVVDNENVGSDLLKNGDLRKRVTIIPLNKISPNVASKATLAIVKGKSPETNLALSLVGYEDEVSKAMEYVFGNTLICPNAAAANDVTFNKDIQMRSVTLDGDVYDPSGTLSGGSKSTGGGVLVKVQKLHKIEEELRQKEKEQAAAEKEWEVAKVSMDKFKKASKELELKVHELGLLEERVGESSATRVSSTLLQYQRLAS